MSQPGLLAALSKLQTHKLHSCSSFASECLSMLDETRLTCSHHVSTHLYANASSRECPQTLLICSCQDQSSSAKPAAHLHLRFLQQHHLQRVLLVPHKQGASSRCAVCALQVSLPASSEHCLAQARVMAKMAVLLKAVPGKDVREKVSCSCLCCCTWHGVGGCFWPSDLSGLRVQTMNIKHSAH